MENLPDKPFPGDPIPVSGSILLDIVRFAAAIAVAVGHF